MNKLLFEILYVWLHLIYTFYILYHKLQGSVKTLEISIFLNFFTIFKLVWSQTTYANKVNF